MNPDAFPYLSRLKSDIQVSEEAPTEDEVEKALKLLKNGKCKGTQGLYRENLKYANSKTFIETLTTLIQEI